MFLRDLPRRENLTAFGIKHFAKQNACQISSTGLALHPAKAGEGLD